MSASRRFKDGERIGKWRLVEHLGRGAFGETWRAEHVELGTHGVVKITDQRGADRLLREARALASIRSRGVQRPIEVDVHQGSLYVVYEWVWGVTLESLLRHGQLGTEELLRLAHALAEALADVHDHGLIHRDIKPSNILIPEHRASETDRRLAFEEAKLLDFGLVGYLSERRDDVGVTMSGMVFGTPVYMSPEQLLGRPQTAASDVWALAAVLVEAATWRLPFRAQEFGDIAQEILTAEPQLRNVRPEPLRDLLARCLQKDPALRPANGEEFLAALAKTMPPSIALTLLPTASIVVDPPYARIEEDRRVLLARYVELVPALAGFFTSRKETLLTLGFLLAASLALTTALEGTAATSAQLAIVCVSVIATGLCAGGLLPIWADQVDATTPAVVFRRAKDRNEAGGALRESMAIDVQALSEWAQQRGSPRERELLELALRRYQDALSPPFQELHTAIDQLLDSVDRVRPWWVRKSAQLRQLVVFGAIAAGLALAAIAFASR